MNKEIVEEVVEKTEGDDKVESIVEATKNIPEDKDVYDNNDLEKQMEEYERKTKEFDKNYKEYMEINNKKIEDLELKVKDLSKTLDRVSQKEVEVVEEKPSWQKSVLGKK